VTEYAEVAVGDLFEARSGRAVFIRDYMEANSGNFPVYSASLVKPFGHVSEFDYDGTYLTWVMNGYGGRVQEVTGRFSASRDRGVFIPRDSGAAPDLTYLRFAMEQQLVAAAVGRRVDGRLNEYTKIYPSTAEEVLISLPLGDGGAYDYARMVAVGDKLHRVEVAQRGVRISQEALQRATLLLEVPEPSITLGLGNTDAFELSIGERVLKSQHTDSGVPVYSANVLLPFGYVNASNLSDFERPSLLWGIDGNFDWNLIPAGEEFATTDHCGRLQIRDERLDPDYVLAYLKFTRARYGFDRVLRASLRNVKADVAVVVPLDQVGEPSLDRQRELAVEFNVRRVAQEESLAALGDILKARMTVHM
jgi:Type I restriction modification DNA specificity domain